MVKFISPVLGIVVGLIIAKVVSYALKKAATTPSLTVVLTIASLYLVQTISVLVGTSHILAVGMFGIHVNSLVDESSPETAEFFTEVRSVTTRMSNPKYHLYTRFLGPPGKRFSQKNGAFGCALAWTLSSLSPPGNVQSGIKGCQEFLTSTLSVLLDSYNS